MLVLRKIISGNLALCSRSKAPCLHWRLLCAVAFILPQRLWRTLYRVMKESNSWWPCSSMATQVAMGKMEGLREQSEIPTNSGDYCRKSMPQRFAPLMRSWADCFPCGLRRSALGLCAMLLHRFFWMSDLCLACSSRWIPHGPTSFWQKFFSRKNCCSWQWLLKCQQQLCVLCGSWTTVVLSLQPRLGKLWNN